jgi:predicted nucleic acid-binding protein
MQLLISDANILIDLEEGELIEYMFDLPYLFSMPDILFVEELEENHEYLVDLGLRLDELSGDTVMYSMELVTKYQNASRNDCFALALATQEKCPLLTGDKALRKAAESESVVVMGTIWLVEQMVKQNLFDTTRARLAFDKMKRSGRRLPWGIADAVLSDIDESFKLPSGE